MANHEITAHTRDGQALSFICGEDENLLGAAERQNIFLPSQCRKGSCGACVAKVRMGTYEIGAVHAELLYPRERAEGHVLLCRTTPHSSLALDLPYDHAFVRRQRVPERWAEILSLKTVAPGTRHLLLALDEDDLYGRAADFEPGQYMEIGVPGTTDRRAYSLANVTNWEGHLEFVIQQRPAGLFSRYLESAKVGDRLSVKGPLGVFTLQEHGLHPRWFIGGGTGVAPLLSMLRRMAEWGESHPAHLYFGAHDAESLFFTSVLRELQGELPQLQVKYCVSNVETRGEHQGNILDTLAADLKSAGTSPDLYLCGSPRLVQGARACALTHGVAPERIYAERFTSA